MTLSLKIPPVAVVIIIAILMYVSASKLPIADYQFNYSLFVVVLLGFMGIVLGLSGVFSFRKSGTTVHPQQIDKASSLVTSGFYQFTRNPMYLGLLLLLVSWGCYLENIASLIIALLFVPYMNAFQIKAEEAQLEKLFGKDYLNYKQKVRRWL